MRRFLCGRGMTTGKMIFLTLLVLLSGFRLRKLHLVRPDLIYYPLPVEVYA